MGTYVRRGVTASEVGQVRGADSYLAFRAGGMLFGVSLEHVVRVLRAVAIQPLPETPDHVLGVLNLHGAPVPVVDPARRLGAQAGSIRAGDQFLLLHTGRRLVGVRVQEAGEVFSPDWKAASADDEPPWPGMERIQAAVETGGEIALIHDPEEFFTAEDAHAVEVALEESWEQAATDSGTEEGA